MRRRRLIAFGAAALLTVTACGSGASTDTSNTSSAEGATADSTDVDAHVVRLPKSYKFEPSSIEIAVGDEVTWMNEDDFPHTVRLVDDESVDKHIGVGESTSISFAEPGVFRYDCSLHPTQMKGQVVVKERAEGHSA